MWTCIGCGTSNIETRAQCEVCDEVRGASPAPESVSGGGPTGATSSGSAAYAPIEPTRKRGWAVVAAAAVGLAIGLGAMALHTVEQSRAEARSLTNQLKVAEARAAAAEANGSDLRRQLQQAQTSADSERRQQLREGDARARAELGDLRTQVAKAKEQLADVESANTSLRQQIKVLQTSYEAAEAELRQRPRVVQATPPPVVIPPATQPVPSQLVQPLLADAETRLGQNKFDAARAIAEVVLQRIDPGNAQARNLLYRIKDRETVYMQGNVTLK